MPVVRIYLVSGRKMDTAESLLKDLRRKANIEYAGGFYDPSGALAEKIAPQPLVSAVASGDENSICKSKSDLQK